MLRKQQQEYTVEDFYFIKIKPMWRYFWSEHPAFWFICGYLFFEYYRPQAIYPIINIIPWSQTLIIGALLFSFFDDKSKLKWTSTHTWLSLFTIQIYLSFLFAYDVGWSVDYQIYFAQWIVIFFAITKIITTRERFYILFLIFFLCSLKIAMGTSRQFAMRGFGFTSWGLKGPPGYFENSGELAILMVVLFACSLYVIKIMWTRSGRLEKLVLVLAITSPAVTVMGASSRGSQLAIAAVLLIYFNYRILNIRVFVVAGMLAFSLLYILPEEQKKRLNDIGQDGTSTQRLLYWENGIEMIKEHPIFGVGYYNFIPYYTNYYSHDMHFRNRRGQLVAELPHNILIQIGTDAGLPAITLYLLFIASLFRNAHRIKEGKVIHKGLAMGVIGFFIAGQFVTVGYYPFLWISAALIVSLKNSYVNNADDMNAKNMIGKKTNLIGDVG